jgi:hypothetical protein
MHENLGVHARMRVDDRNGQLAGLLAVSLFIHWQRETRWPVATLHMPTRSTAPGIARTLGNNRCKRICRRAQR